MVACALPRCRQESMLLYYGRGVCEAHWLQHCSGRLNLKSALKVTDG